MPLTRVSLRRGKNALYRKAILDSLYLAMRDSFDVPENDRFMITTEHDAEDFIFGTNYMDVSRSDDLVMIQITVSNTRTVDQKKALFRRIADRLAESPGLRQEDIFINLLEVRPENWSFGNGIAHYAKSDG